MINFYLQDALTGSNKILLGFADSLREAAQTLQEMADSLREVAQKMPRLQAVVACLDGDPIASIIL